MPFVRGAAQDSSVFARTLHAPSFSPSINAPHTPWFAPLCRNTTVDREVLAFGAYTAVCHRQLYSVHRKGDHIVLRPEFTML